VRRARKENPSGTIPKGDLFLRRRDGETGAFPRKGIYFLLITKKYNVEPIVQIAGLSHRYSTSWAIRDINMEITQNGIVGLLGSNGAGKSTTMNIMCGVITPTEGKVVLNGVDMKASPEEAKQQIGFLPQTPPLYLDLTIDEYLRHCAILRSMEGSVIDAAIRDVKQRCGIAHFSKRLIRNLSGGYRQRVGIAQAIIHRPRIVVLDEPTNGLDPNQIVEVRGLIREIAEDRVVLLSTHILSEVNYLCRDILMIESGRIVFSDTMAAFDNYFASHSLLAVMEELPAVEDLQRIEGVLRVEMAGPQQMRIYFDGDRSVPERIVLASAQQGWRLSEISMEKRTLDETFSRISKMSK
jgi:ABC-2 type transport system ATP-binding protein